MIVFFVIPAKAGIYDFQNMINPFKLISTEKIYENPWMRLDEDQVEKDGKTGIFGVVTMNSGVAVLLIDEKNHVILSKEYKYALKRYDVNLPGGAMDPGETPLECAKRETEEELGYTAKEWISLGHIHPLTTTLIETEHLFLARGLMKTGKHEDTWEEIEEIRLPYQKVLEMAMNSEITHAGSVVAILKAEKHIYKP